MLDVQSGDDVDLRGQGLLQIFVALAVLAAGYIGVRKLVNENDCWFAGDDSVNVHFLEDRTFIVHRLARNGFELGREFLNALAAMGFDDTDDDIFAAALAANGLAQHAVGLAYTGSVA